MSSIPVCFSPPIALIQFLKPLQLRAHYFEEGNVQMQTTKTLPPTPLPPTNDETTAAVAAVDVIQQAEATVQVGGVVGCDRYPYKFTFLIPPAVESHITHLSHPQRGLEAIYNKLGDEDFRSLRRKLPVSKIKMDWSRGQAHKLSRTLNDGRG